MTKALVWLIFTYAVLKLAAMARARSPGFRRAGMRFADRVRAGEPVVFLAALTLSLPLALLSNWYVHRTLTGLYENSTGCYGRLMALKDVPAFRDHVDGFTIYERVQGDKEAAFAMATELKMKPDEVSRTLADQVKFFAARYATLQRQAMQQKQLNEIGAARRCLLPPGAASNVSRQTQAPHASPSPSSFARSSSAPTKLPLDPHVA